MESRQKVIYIDSIDGIIWFIFKHWELLYFEAWFDKQPKESSTLLERLSIQPGNVTIRPVLRNFGSFVDL